MATIFQVRWGVKLPLIHGSMIGHIPTYLAPGSLEVSPFANPIVTMHHLMGALLVEAMLGAGSDLSKT